MTIRSRCQFHRSLTNTAAERALRGVALGQRCLRFAGSERGVQRAAVMYTLIGTAKLNGIDPQACLVDVIARMTCPSHDRRNCSRGSEPRPKPASRQPDRDPRWIDTERWRYRLLELLQRGPTVQALATKLTNEQRKLRCIKDARVLKSQNLVALRFCAYEG